jgi:hypothetical protein
MATAPSKNTMAEIPTQRQYKGLQLTYPRSTADSGRQAGANHDPEIIISLWISTKRHAPSTGSCL